MVFLIARMRKWKKSNLELFFSNGFECLRIQEFCLDINSFCVEEGIRLKNLQLFRNN